MPTILPPTKSEVRWRALGYLSVGALGLFVTLAPPVGGGVRSELGFAVTLIWSLFMSSSLVAVYATLRGKYRVEYVVLPLFTVALLVAVITGWAGVWGDPPDWQKAARVVSATALVFFLIARYSILRRIVRAVKAREPWTIP